MSKADKIQSVIMKVLWGGVSLYAILALREAAKRKATEDYYAEKNDGVGKTPSVYTKRLFDRYASCYKITEAVVILTDKDSKGRYYVECGDERGGRGFYATPELVKRIRRYCAWRCLPFEFVNPK